MPKIFITRPIPKVGIEMLKEKGFEVAVNEAARAKVAAPQRPVRYQPAVDADGAYGYPRRLSGDMHAPFQEEMKCRAFAS